ncbi:MAG: iron-sulfur cluster assembly accessory protein [Bacteroidota bacterium]
MAEVIDLPITITETAIAEIKRLQAEDPEKANQVLRIGVKGGGCSGLSYILEFDETNELDQEFTVEGVTIVLDARHGLYVQGMTVDFKNGLNARGFEFINPNAKESCGCGESFSV